MKKSILIGFICALASISYSQIIATYAGTGVAGYTGDGGQATNAALSNPRGICLDASGSVYFVDSHNSVVRKINSSGIITTIAGTGTAGDGGTNVVASSTPLFDPRGITCDKAGNLYIADYIKIRKINTAGIMTTIAGTSVQGYSGDGGLATAANLRGTSVMSSIL